jgi:hypothetical protein
MFNHICVQWVMGHLHYPLNSWLSKLAKQKMLYKAGRTKALGSVLY